MWEESMSGDLREAILTYTLVDRQSQTSGHLRMAIRQKYGHNHV